jgi:translation initiation factor IF-3
MEGFLFAYFIQNIFLGGKLTGKDLRINEEIRVREVRLIDATEKQMGIVPIVEALRLADEASLDLVEIAPQAQPPVCKILDYGKFKFDSEKKARLARKSQKQVQIKEIRMQPNIDSHDLEFKAKNAKEFLEKGNKVKFTVRFRGREMAHTDIGRETLDKIVKGLGMPVTVEKTVQMEGRMMSITVTK